MGTTVNHYTVNTNHSNSFNFTDIHTGMLAVIQTTIDRAVNNEFVEVFNGIHWNLKSNDDWYVSTLSKKSEKGEYVPFLITAGCIDKRVSQDTMSAIRKVYNAFFDGSVTLEPEVPYVCDVFYPTFSSKEEMMFMLGVMIDFNTTLFWHLFGDRQFS